MGHSKGNCVCSVFFSSRSLQTTAFRLCVKRTCVSSFSLRSVSSCRALQSFLDCSALCSSSGRDKDNIRRDNRTEVDVKEEQKKERRRSKPQTYEGDVYLGSSSSASCSPAQPPPAFLSETWKDRLVNTPLTRTVKCLDLEIISGPGKNETSFRALTAGVLMKPVS